MAKNKTIGNKIIIGLIILFLGISVIPSITVNADSTTMFNPTDDVVLLEEQPTTNVGYGPTLRVRTFSGMQRTNLIKFDISSISSGTIIKSAMLNLYWHAQSDGDSSGHNVCTYRVTGNWDEDAVTWNTQPSHNPTETDTIAMPSSPGVWVSWDVTDDVQSFVNGTLDNYGWKLIDTHASAQVIADFYSKEYLDYYPGEPSGLEPYLEIKTTPDTVYVDDGYDSGTSGWGFDHFNKIQDGINVVLEGGTVHVNSGIYYENVLVNKTVDLQGSDKATTIIDGGGSGNVVYVTADGVSINGLTIQNSGGTGYDSGVDIDSNSNTISNNIIINNREGVRLRQSKTLNVISDNTVTSNSVDGIWLYYADGNTISGNTISSNLRGIIFQSSNDNSISSNTLNSNTNEGIYLEYSDNRNTISSNTLSGNMFGVFLKSSSNENTISSNTFSSHSNNGVRIMDSCSNNEITGNTFTNVHDGIRLFGSDNNNITENTFNDNDFGVHLYESSDNNNVYHNNFYDNNHNGWDDGTNSWDDGIEGNYWDDYTGTDSNCDGIGDTPYDIEGGSNQDLYPMMDQDGWDNNAPTADASGPYYANVNNAITFDGSGSTDSDGSITGYRWDWTNNGEYDTDWLTSATTTHSYPNAGTYTVKLQIKDDDGICGTDTATATISPLGETPIPTADVNGPYTGYLNYDITFSSSGSAGGPGGTIVSWYWTFGDGAASSEQNPTHMYIASGTYTVTLKVTNNYDETDVDTITATVTELSQDQTPPVADAGGPYLGVVNSLITFDGSGSNDSNGTIVNYEWDFGDGGNGTGISSTHIYTTAGNYTVMLTVTDNETLTHSNSTTANINVSGPPTIVIFVDVSNIEPIEEENEKTIPVTVYCYHQSVSNIRLEILESSNLTITSLSPNISLNPGEQKELLIKIKAPKLEKTNDSEEKVSDETIILQAVGDDNIISNTEQINLKVIGKNATPGFDTIAAIAAVGTAGALVGFFRRRNGNR